LLAREVVKYIPAHPSIEALQYTAVTECWIGLLAQLSIGDFEGIQSEIDPAPRLREVVIPGKVLEIGRCDSFLFGFVLAARCVCGLKINHNTAIRANGEVLLNEVLHGRITTQIGTLKRGEQIAISGGLLRKVACNAAIIGKQQRLRCLDILGFLTGLPVASDF